MPQKTSLIRGNRIRDRDSFSRSASIGVAFAAFLLALHKFLDLRMFKASERLQRSSKRASSATTFRGAEVVDHSIRNSDQQDRNTHDDDAGTATIDAGPHSPKASSRSGSRRSRVLHSKDNARSSPGGLARRSIRAITRRSTSDSANKLLTHEELQAEQESAHQVHSRHDAASSCGLVSVTSRLHAPPSAHPAVCVPLLPCR